MKFKRIIITFIVLLSAVGCSASKKSNHASNQNGKSEEPEVLIFEIATPIEPEFPDSSICNGEDVYDFAGREPMFPGGMDSMYVFINSNLERPEGHGSIDMQGTVFVQIIICKDGSITNAKVVRGFDPDGWDKEALRVINEMPDWLPGAFNDIPVNCKFIIPVRIQSQ